MEKSPELIPGVISRLQAHILRRLVIICITLLRERECRSLSLRKK